MEKTYKRQVALVDTGILYAISDEDDSWHERAKAFLENSEDTLIIPATVLPEACYLLNSYLGWEAELSFIKSINHGEFRVEQINRDDYMRISDLLKTYSSANIGFVDASVIAVAERLKISRILTTDRRHFSIVRPLHCHTFVLLP